MFNLVLIVSNFILLFIATITDLKSREISNRLILFFLIFGISFKLLYSVLTKDFTIVSSLFFAFIISFLVFFLLWEVGVIAGGDLKLFIVLSVLIPKLTIPFNISLLFFPVVIFIVSLFMVIPWILLYSLYIIITKKLYLGISKTIFSKPHLNHTIDSTLVAFLIGLIYSLFSKVTPLILIGLAFVFSFLIFKIKNKNVFYIVLSGLYVLIITLTLIENQIINLSLSNFMLVFIFVFLISILTTIYKTIKEKILVETKTINKLKEGDLLVYNYYLSKKKVKLVKPNLFTKIKMLVNNTYHKDLKVDSSKACGISKEDILFLKYLYKNNLIDNKIYLRKTTAFVPAVLLSYILIILI